MASQKSGPAADAAQGRTLLVCSCEGTMPVDAGAIARGCGATPRPAEALCRRQLDMFRQALSEGAQLTVGCTQERPLFEDCLLYTSDAADE